MYKGWTFEAKSFEDYVALAIDREDDSKPEHKRPKLDPVLEPEKTKLCSPAVKFDANDESVHIFFSLMIYLFRDPFTWRTDSSSS